MRIYFVLLELLFISISVLINGQNPKQYELDYGVSYEPEYFDNYANDRYFNELKAFFDRYTERKQARHFAIKREALINEGGFYRPVGNFEWLKRNPKSVLVGSIAAVTLFLGLVLTVGIVVRRRYLINSSSPSKSLIGQEAGDKKLAHSAQMYHYQFQKQQILAMEKASIKNEQSEDEGTDVETDGDFAVYECSGIPKTNEMEVKNPFFAGGKQSSEEGNCNADDELINTSQRSSLENSDTFVEDKRKEVESAKINKKN